MRLIIIGAGGFGRTVRDLAEQSGKYEKILFLDDAASGDGNDVAGKVSDFRDFIDDDTEFLVAFGNNELRYKTLVDIAEAGGKIGCLIHSTAYVSPTALVGEGCVILPNACVGTDVVISDGCIINMGAIVDHKVMLGVCVHAAPGAIIKGENAIKAFTKIESGEVVERGQFPLGE